MPYYKLRHTDGVIMWFENGHSDLEPAGVETPVPAPAVPRVRVSVKKTKTKSARKTDDRRLCDKR